MPFARHVPTRTLVPFLISFAALASSQAHLPAQEVEGKRYAVLVGVNEYQHKKLEPLKFAVNDATELGRLLEKAGYTVTVLTDETGKNDAKLAPTKANIESKLKTVLESAKSGDLVLVCLAGHGLQFEGQKDAFFCPSDARPFKDKADTLVSLKKVYDELDGSFAGMKVLLVDACRDDPVAGRGIGADTAPRPPQGVAAIFSCKAGQRAFEHDKLKHGVFFHHVITGLQGEAADKKGRVTFAALASHVGQEVPGDVSRLIGNGAVQTPNLKAEYTNEPLLLSRAVAIKPPKKTEAEQVLADLRAMDRAERESRLLDFLREESPKRLTAWTKAAEGGVSAGQVLLASCLLYGIGVTADNAEAIKWFGKGAEAGESFAMYMLGFVYQNGHGVEKNEKEGVKWYKKGAEAGEPFSMTSLGMMYRDGSGVEKDEKEGVKWFRKGAESGDLVAMTSLGHAYENGLGMERDLGEAVKWYRKAAALDDEYAKKALERLGEK